MDGQPSQTGSAEGGDDAGSDHGQRFDEFVGQRLETVAAAATVFFVLFTAVQPLYFDPPLIYPLAALGVATVLAFATVWWTSREGQVPDELAQPVLTVGLCLLLLNALAVSTVSGSPITTVWFALVALLGGGLLLSHGWLVGLLAADVAAWVVVLAVSPPHPGWTGYAVFVLVAAVALAALAQITRRRVYSDLVDREQALLETDAELERVRREAERARKLQSRFMANVSHDVRTPAAAIVGEARNLQSRELEPEQQDSVATIEASARHLVRLIEDILDIAKAEAGQLSIEEEPFRIERVLRESVEMVANQAREKGLEIASEIGDDVPPVVRADPHRLQQILGNILSNAVKFTPEGGVRVRASLDTEDPLVLRFDVEDTGIGIPEDRQEDLFRPFHRLDRDPEIEGAGLGLAICRRLVTALGGEIDVESTPGEGSTFAFRLPVERAEAEAIEETDEPVRLAGRRAWLVGTEGFPADALDRWGFDTETMAGIGFVEEALAGEGRPSLIVLDTVTIEAPEDFLAERVRSWRHEGIAVLVVKEEGQAFDELDAIPGPGAVVTPAASEHDLREAVTSSLREALRVGRSPTASDPGLAQRHPLDILVVEDSPVNRRLVVQMLGTLGYEARSAERAEEALAALDTAPADLVVLDLGLPGASGAELAQEIGERVEDPPRLVALTGHTDEETLAEAREAGIEAVLTKPTSLAELRAQVEDTPQRSTEDET